MYSVDEIYHGVTLAANRASRSVYGKEAMNQG